jgi:hypothetical protein
MYQTIRRDEMGRIIGSLNEFHTDENESWHDQKELDVIFPRHIKDYNSEVKTFHISELNR